MTTTLHAIGLGLALFLPAAASGATGTWTATAGRSPTLSVTRADSSTISVTARDATATLTKRLCGSLLGRERCLAEVDLAARVPTPGQAALRLGGKTVFSRSVSSDVTHSVPITFVSVFGAPVSRDLDLGAVGVRVSADFGGGGQFGATWRLAAKEPRAHLIGAAQTYALGLGSATFRVLWGTGKASGELTVTAFNSTTKLRGLASARDQASSSAIVELIPWNVKLKIKLSLLGVTIGRITVIDASGSTQAKKLI